MKIDRLNYPNMSSHVESKGITNTTAPPVVLEIQKVSGNEAVLQFIIKEYDSIMAAYISIRKPDSDLIWAYQRIVSEDLIASVQLSDADDPKGVIERFKSYVGNGRQERETIGRLDRKAIGTL